MDALYNDVPIDGGYQGRHVEKNKELKAHILSPFTLWCELQLTFQSPTSMGHRLSKLLHVYIHTR